MEWINDTPYSCPLLMYFQSILKPKQFWKYGTAGWVLMDLESVRARSIWSKKVILLEMGFYNSRIGLLFRKLSGSQQREYRLKFLNKIDGLLEEKKVLSNLQIIG